MKRKYRAGLPINLFLMAIALITGPLAGVKMNLPTETEIYKKGFILQVITAGMTLLLSAAAKILGSTESVWRRPSLGGMPINLRHPLQSILMVGVMLVTMSVGCVIANHFVYSSYAWILFGSLGSGLLIGVFIATLLFSQDT